MEAAALLESSGDRPAGTQVLALVGELHYLRFKARGPDGHADLMVACLMYAPLLAHSADVIPVLVRDLLVGMRRKWFDRHAPPSRTALRRALKSRGPAADAWAAVAAHAAGVLWEMFRATKDHGSLAEAGAVLTHAIRLTPVNDPERQWRLSDAGKIAFSRHLLDQDARTLDASIDALRQASGLPDQGSTHGALATALLTRFLRDRRRPDIEAAVTAGRRCVEATPSGHPQGAEREALFAAILLGRCAETQEPADLDEALNRLRAALPDIADDRLLLDVLRPLIGYAYGYLYEMVGDGSALAAAAGLAAVPPVTPDTAVSRDLDAVDLLLRTYLRTQEPHHLDQATRTLRHIETSRRDLLQKPSRDGHRLCLAFVLMLLEKGARTEDRSLEEAAVRWGRLALRLAGGPVARCAANNHLGLALMARYRSSGGPDLGLSTRMDTLDEALECFLTAIDEAPAGHPSATAALVNLGQALLQADEVGDRSQTLDRASEVFGDTTAPPSASPRARVELAVAAGRMAGSRCDWSSAVRHFQDAVGLLDHAVPRSLARGDREFQLKRLRGLAGEAAAAAVRIQDDELAATLFEQGRGVLLAQSMDTRVDLVRLAAVAPGLAADFQRLSGQMDEIASGLAGSGRTVGHAETVAARRRLTGQWDRLVDEIRRKPGLDGFLLAPHAEDLIAAARYGPIVQVSTSWFGSVALLVRANGIESVCLPRLDPPTARTMVAELRRNIAQNDEEQLLDLLGWMWDVIVGPVLDHLGMNVALEPGASGPRLWWSPSGLLSFLPLHAAGHHTTSSAAAPLTAMDRVISSYVPTVRSLEYARRQPVTHSSPPLVVAMPVTPGHPPLLAVEREVTLLQDLFGAKAVIGEQATREAVRSTLPDHPWVHFSCHARSDMDDPAQGFLALHDHETGGLTAGHVAALRLPHAELAFLSACETWQSGATLADKAIHLGSAFQLAGYRHVIATLWPVAAGASEQIADHFYNALKHDGLTAAPGALHQVTRAIRDLVPEQPSVWAAHVHSGP
ncbi:CHAT domain-containing protein [Sphaerisporangium rubeum]|uniref:Tetratricopeptide (TPR) repeat protein n=1 Tax=Sphaerisporangium rubeum TaxID=321317 RepID=A0A7X0M5B3_9ACTN|nr:CHAT domain-containing protein [Sphaerisporangium rubeum]MBB6472458.1 tetratricopeptide (TPR) repeat protein [Sphaerisporangium rubeum]